jgi:hypothetical protein
VLPAFVWGTVTVLLGAILVSSAGAVSANAAPVVKNNAITIETAKRQANNLFVNLFLFIFSS